MSVEDTRHGKWTVRTNDYDGAVSAECDGERWELRYGNLCAEVKRSEEVRHFDSGCPSDRYLPVPVLLEMLWRNGWIQSPVGDEA